ncbi:MAG TPA: flagellar motor protein MotB [Verrucomicrobiae bacterium]|jgi:chemotaxis protein MotB
MSKKGGHHGGAWKVAYADFVTAMMALFMVLWLAAQDQKIKEAVERAFRNPFMSLTKDSSGLMPTKNNDSSKGGSGKFDNGTASQMEVAMLRRLQSDLAKSLAKAEEPEEEESVKFNLTAEGLRINIFDRARKPVFEPDSDRFTDYGTWILTTLAWEIARYKSFLIELEGHTERGHKLAGNPYGVWELSADRANAGRRKLLQHGVDEAQVRKVAGFADTNPLPGYPPENAINRRITLLLRVQSEQPKR